MVDNHNTDSNDLMDSIDIKKYVTDGFINMGTVSDIKTLNNPGFQYGTVFAVVRPFRVPACMSSDDKDFDAHIGDMVYSIQKDNNKKPYMSWKLIKLAPPPIQRITMPLNADAEIVAEYEPDCIYNKDLNIYIKTKTGEKLLVRVAGDYKDNQQVWVTVYDNSKGDSGVIKDSNDVTLFTCTQLDTLD